MTQHIRRTAPAPFRRRGLARALYARLSWAVPDWNNDAIALYDEIAAPVN